MNNILSQIASYLPGNLSQFPGNSGDIPLLENPAVFQPPALRLNNSYDLPMLGDSPVATEPNPLPPPSAQMPKIPGIGSDAETDPLANAEAVDKPPREKLAAKLLKGLLLAGGLGAIGGAPLIGAGAQLSTNINTMNAARTKAANDAKIAQAKQDAEDLKTKMEQQRIDAIKENNASLDASRKQNNALATEKFAKGTVGDIANWVRDTFLGKPTNTAQQAQARASDALAEKRKTENKILEGGGIPSLRAKSSGGSGGGGRSPKQSPNAATLTDGTVISFNQYKMMAPGDRSKIKDNFANPNQAVNWDITLGGQPAKGQKSTRPSQDIAAIDRAINTKDMEIAKAQATNAFPEDVQKLQTEKTGLLALRNQKSGKRSSAFEDIMSQFQQFKKEAQ